MQHDDLMSITNDLFFDSTDFDPRQVDNQIREALTGADDGEMYLEYTKKESVLFNDGK